MSERSRSSGLHEDAFALELCHRAGRAMQMTIALRSGVGNRDHRGARTLRIVLRVLGAVVGGYALTALAVTALGAVMTQLGMARAEAVTLAAMLGFVIYLALLLWGFSVKSVVRLWLTFAGGAAALAGLLWLVC